MRNSSFLMSLVITLVIVSSSLTFAQVPDPTLWGMSYSDGADSAGYTGLGNIFKVNSDGTGYEQPYTFTETYRGANPYYTHLVQAPNGKLYGTTYDGGKYNYGTLFEFDPATNMYVDKHDFNYPNGTYPFGDMIVASNGNLYGMASHGDSAYSNGVIFEFNPDSGLYTKKFEFIDYTTGYTPFGGLLEVSPGKFYGMTEDGGAGGKGVLFEYNDSTNTFTKKLNFSMALTGTNPYGNLIKANNGKLYGLTSYGGSTDVGALFEYDIIANTCTIKVNFGIDGSHPYGSLLQAQDGKLYGLTSYGGFYNGGVIFQYDPATSIYTVKANLSSSVEGYAPNGNLIQLANGKMYALTACVPGGYGTLIEYNPVTNTVALKFTFDGAIFGKNPYGSLMEASDGKLYGMTEEGGYFYEGTLFDYDPLTDSVTLRITFGEPYFGYFPLGNFAQGNDSTFYGLTQAGGDFAGGTLFQFDHVAGSIQVKHFFGENGDGVNPYNTLMFASNGKFYGGTASGGVNGSGIIFEYDPSLETYTKFDLDNIGGISAEGNFAEGANGKIYGTTTSGGTNFKGILFEYDPATGILTKKKDFDNINGQQPTSGLVLAGNNKLYGTTDYGGPSGMGNLFEYDPATNILTNKKNFTGAANGSYPLGSLILSSNGKIYGLTQGGGANNMGTIFEYDPALNTLTKKFDFDGVNHGDYPTDGLYEASNGKFYGTTDNGGIDDLGIVFEYDTDAGSVMKLIDFSLVTGVAPFGDLTEQRNLYTLATPISLCAAESFNLTYALAGKVCQGNTFTAQLSDSNGNFGSPVSIGSLSSTHPGVITCMIPGNTPGGDHYRIRMVSDNPVFTGPDNGSDLIINPLMHLFLDADSDSFGNANIDTLSCDSISGYVADSTDCDDANASIYPGAIEIPGNGIDDNCDGITDECEADFTLYPDTLTLHHYWAVNQATGVPPLTYTWSWGDGTFDTIAYPSHIYADSGFYTICLSIHDSTGCIDTVCNSYTIQKMTSAEALNTMVYVDVIADIPTTIKTTEVLQSWSVFPNPAWGNININYSLSTMANVTIYVTDVLGNRLQRSVANYQEGGKYHSTIDSRKLVNGIYFLQIHVGDQIASQKIVVMN